MNIFLGVPVPAVDIHLLMEMLYQEYPHWRDHPAIRWTEDEHHHLTLHFFGAIDPALLSEWIADLDRYLSAIHCLTITVNRLDNFPKPDSDLLAAHVHLSSALAKLYRQVQQSVQDHQFPTESRAYSPHITLCRAKRRHFLRMTPIIVPDHSLSVTRLILYQTQPTASGSQYVPLHQWTLQPRPRLS
jgi:RNA 2',3'-cyclic 3'-phosphodiesterase